MADIHAAMLAAQKAIGKVAKRDRNTEQNYSFRGVDAVVNAVGPALRDAGIFVVPEVDRLDYDPVSVERTKNGRTYQQHSIQVRAYVAYSFVAADGSQITARVVGEAIDYGDKGVSKAMSVALRTALLQVFSIPTDDPEPDAESYTRSGGSGGQVQRGRGQSPDQDAWASDPTRGRRQQPPTAPEGWPEPYNGTDDDFAIDLANLEDVGDLEALRDLWRAVTLVGRQDQAEAVGKVVAAVRAKAEASGSGPAKAEASGSGPANEAAQ